METTTIQESYLTSPKGLRSWLVTLDHKRIGLLYLISILIFFLVGGTFALLVRLELFKWGGQPLFDPNTYNRLFTYHGAIMIFMVIIPSIPASLGNFVLPLLVGAKDVAFPRLNLLSYYLFLGGALFAVTSLFLGGVDTGWTFYTPYSIRTGGAIIWVLTGAFIMGFSSILTGLNFIVTIHQLRAPGLTWGRLPLLCWALYATGIIQLLATPVLAITLVLLAMERLLKIGIFDPALGGDPVLFQHFFWFYSHPAVYIMIVPAMGVISEIIPVFSRKPIFGYKAIAYSSFGIAFVSFLVWGHHMFVSGQSEFANIVFSLLTFFVSIPTGIKVFSWVGTLYRGVIHFQVPMLYALGFLEMFLIGGLTGIFLATISIHIHLTETYFVVAHFHYTMFGGALMAFIAGLFYWFPKMFGRFYSHAWGVAGFWLVFLGFNLTFLPQFVAGSEGMPRRYWSYLPEYLFWNRMSTVGSWILGLGFLCAAYSLYRGLRFGKKASPNPWNAKTLEWTAPSPPPLENFHISPIVNQWPYEYESSDTSLGIDFSEKGAAV